MSPLADRMRPSTLDEYIGQKHILSPDKLLYRTIKSGQIFSMILWGPPGVGKTTIARIIAHEVNARFLEFSAVNAGIAEIKKLFAEITAAKKTLFQPEKTIIFIDEIHRFNKAQQDAFLPHVENGDIILIGATTENPSFEVIGALLSRTRVFTLQQLNKEELGEIVKRALNDKVTGLGNQKIKFAKGALDLLIEGSNGDSRILLNALEVAVQGSSIPVISNESERSPDEKRPGSIILTKALIEEALQQRALQYDKGGEEHYNTISAFIKSMRASQVDAALYYLARMVKSGEDPLFIARRMVIFASEDVGMAQPTALVVANEVFRACETIGYPECQINLAHGVAYLASAKKDRSSYEAYFEALADVEKLGNLPIPLNLRNAPTKLMKEIGYGQGYQKYDQENYLPERIRGKKYYKNRL